MRSRLGLRSKSTAIRVLSRLLHYVAALVCAVVASSTTSAGAADTNDYFSSLKQFLNTNLDQFEIVFSENHHSNPTMVALDKALQNATSLLDKPVFYRVRLASDGFFTHRAFSLPNIQNRIAEGMTEHITGFYSNTVWTSHSRILDLDKAQALEKSARLGPDWWKSAANGFARRTLTMGLNRAKPGTFEWNGTNFTAVAADFGVSPEDKGKRVIAGGLAFTGGKPYMFSYTVGTNATIYRVSLVYQLPVPGGFNIPNQIVTADPIPGNGNGDNIFSVEILSLFATNFPAGSTSPDEFRAHDGMEIETSTDGVHTMTGFNGKPLPRKPAPPSGHAPSSNSFNGSNSDVR